jgi:protein ImuB
MRNLGIQADGIRQEVHNFRRPQAGTASARSALGSIPEALTPLMPPEVPRAVLRLAEPVGDPEALKRIIDKLCEGPCLRLEARGIGAGRLDLVFLRVDNIPQAARIGLSRPYRDPARSGARRRRCSRIVY